MDWATTDALMERALVNWRSVKDRAPDGTPEMTLSLNICGSAMAEAEEAYGLYVRGKRKPSSIPRPEEVFFNPSCKRKPSSIHHARGRPEPSKDEEAIDAEDEEKVTGGSDAIDAEDEKKVTGGSDAKDEEKKTTDELFMTEKNDKAKDDKWQSVEDIFA